MINKAIAQFQSDLTSLAWVENYGGLTHIVSNPSISDDGSRYPVSQFCNFEQCWNGGVYKALVPDSNTKSLMYYEQIGSTTDAGDSFRVGDVSLDTPVRLFTWVNLQKIGLDQTTTKSPFVNDILNIFKVVKSSDGARFEVKLTEIETDDITKEQFAKYNYNNLERLLYYPYLAITITFNFNIKGDVSCMDSVAVGEEIACKNYSYT